MMAHGGLGRQVTRKINKAEWLMIGKLKELKLKANWEAMIVASLAWFWLYPQVLIGLHWHDTSEFIAASRTLAVAHPPGHPLTLVVMHIAELIPFFDCAERAHLASSFWGALGAAATYLGLKAFFEQQFAQQKQPSSLIIKFWSFLLSLIGVALPLVTLQLIRAEVYAPQWALTAVVWSGLFYAERYSDQRAYLLSALCLGLLSANHTLLTLALGLSLLPKLCLLGLSARTWFLSALSFTLGLSLYLYLYLRGTSGGMSGWGWITDIQSLWDTISAKVWQIQVEQRTHELDWTDNIIRFFLFSMKQMGIWVSLPLLLFMCLNFVSALKGIVRSFFTKANSLKNSWGLTLCFATLAIAFTKLSYPFSEGNPDFSGYVSAAVPSVLALIALSLIHSFEALKRHNSKLISLMISCFLLLILGSTLAQKSKSRSPYSRGAELWGQTLMNEVPLGGHLWTSFYASHFITVALQTTQGWRADLNLTFRGHRHLAWSLKRLQTETKPFQVTSLHSLKDLQGFQSRFEVERPLDSIVQFWPLLSWPSQQYGFLTSGWLTEPKLHLNQDAFYSAWSGESTWLGQTTWSFQEQLKYNQNLIQLADARQVRQIQSLGLVDEDSAYAWALHYEMTARWLNAYQKTFKLPP